MNNNDENKAINKQLQDSFDALAILMNSQTQSQEDIKNAVKHTKQLHQTIERTINQFTQDIPKIIRGSATESADVISFTVSNRLQDTNNTAIKTTNIFKQASNKLGLKIFGFNLLILILCIIMMGIFFISYVPSFDEIANRRTELAYLERSIQDLKKQASISSCKIDEKTSLPCIRIKEIKGRGPWGENGENYQLIWQGK